MTKTTIESLYPLPVYINDGYKLSKSKKDKLIQETKDGHRFNVLGNITSNNHNVLDNPYLSALKKHLIKQVNNYAYEILCINKKVEVYITQSWLNINPKGTPHHTHRHHNSFISGTYYLQGSTPIFFLHNTMLFQNFDFDVTERNYFNTSICNINVEDGRCILFPSALQHGVDPNQEEEERISLSFNTFIRGELKPTEDWLTKLTIK